MIDNMPPYMNLIDSPPKPLTFSGAFQHIREKYQGHRMSFSRLFADWRSLADEINVRLRRTDVWVETREDGIMFGCNEAKINTIMERVDEGERERLSFLLGASPLVGGSGQKITLLLA